jgi:hypothetical protein
MYFQGQLLQNEGSSDVFLATYGNSFSPGEITSLGGRYTDTTTALALATSGVVCLAGSFQHSIDLGPGDISAPIYGNAVGEFWLDRLIVS